MHKVPYLKRDRQTDGRTDGRTDSRTSSTLYPLVFTEDNNNEHVNAHMYNATRAHWFRRRLYQNTNHDHARHVSIYNMLLKPYKFTLFESPNMRMLTYTARVHMGLGTSCIGQQTLIMLGMYQ